MQNFGQLFETRCERMGKYIVEHHATVRSAAAHFGISKSTVHKDVTKDLRIKNIGLYREVSAILRQNKEERHLRGGEATKQKYNAKRQKGQGKKFDS